MPGTRRGLAACFFQGRSQEQPEDRISDGGVVPGKVARACEGNCYSALGDTQARCVNHDQCYRLSTISTRV